MTQDRIAELKRVSTAVRRNILESISSLGMPGHVGGSLSMAEVLTTLYFYAMRVDPKNPKMEGRDRLIVSKGHSGPAVYSVLVEKGYFDKSKLFTLNRLGTDLPSHCDMNRTPGIDMTTGSLGQGFSCAVGVAIGSKMKKDGAVIYTIVGDGESQEGQIWEAAMLASQKKLDNLIAFTDYNKKQLDGTIEEINSLLDLAAKWRSFGFNVAEVDGHDIEAIAGAIDNAKAVKGVPSMIILHTVKGKGVSFVEDMGVLCHSTPVSPEQLARALQELKAEGE